MATSSGVLRNPSPISNRPARVVIIVALAAILTAAGFAAGRLAPRSTGAPTPVGSVVVPHQAVAPVAWVFHAAPRRHGVVKEG